MLTSEKSCVQQFVYFRRHKPQTEKSLHDPEVEGIQRNARSLTNDYNEWYFEVIARHTSEFWDGLELASAPGSDRKYLTQNFSFNWFNWQEW